MSLYEGRHTRYRALAREVLVVAVQGGRGDDWAAYIGAVPGMDHDREWEEVARSGSKLPREVAEVLFWDFADKYEWRP